LKLRNRQVEEGMAGRAESLMFKGFERAMKSPALFKAGAKVGRLAQKPLVKDGSIEGAPLIRGWTDFRELAPLAEKSFRELWKEGI
jgi:L-lactate dehydrogenase complex protein LldF